MKLSTQQLSNRQPNIVRTEKGLTIAGTKTTLYDVLDYLKDQHSPTSIRNKLRLSKAQISAAFAYIEAYRTELEAEYREILQMAEKNRKYWASHRWEINNWGTRSRYRLAPVRSAHNELEEAALRAKLRAWQNKLSVTV